MKPLKKILKFGVAHYEYDTGTIIYQGYNDVIYSDKEIRIRYDGTVFTYEEKGTNVSNEIDDITNCTADEMFNYSTIFDAAKVREVQAELIKKGQC